MCIMQILDTGARTHCVSASDARALTQMDTNTAGTPYIRKKTKKKKPIARQFLFLLAQ